MNPRPPVLSKKQPPHYPETARRERIEGTVSVDVIIGADGVTRVRRIIETPHASLEESTVEALKEWRYQPAECNGQPVSLETILEVNYSLR